MSDVDPDTTDAEVHQVHQLVDQLLGFPSREDAFAFLQQHRERINYTLIKLLKDQISHLVRVDLNRALEVADLITVAAELAGDPLSRALSAHARAMALDRSGKCAEALKLYNQAETIYQSLGQEVEAARVARAKLPVLMYLGHYDRALQVAAEARRVLQQHDQWALVAQVDANVGSIYERLAQYHTALRYYQQAAEVFERLNDRRSLALVQANEAVVYSHLNEFERSLALYEQARRIYSELGLHLWAIRVDHNVAWLHFLRGKFDLALRQFHRVEQEAEKHGDITQVAVCQLDLAEVYLQLNAFEDALRASQTAIEQFAQLQMTAELAKAQMYHGVAHLHLGALDRATQSLEQARALFSQEGNQIYQALCDLYLGEVALREGAWSRAFELCRAASQTFEAHQLDNKAAYAQFQLARIRFHAGDVQAAQRFCQQALQKVESLEAPWLHYQCFHLEGNIAERLGDERAAYRSYERAIHHIEEMRSSIRVDEFKASFVRDKLKVYEDMVALCLEDGSPEKKQRAFGFAEAAKSRALVDLLSNALKIKSRAESQIDRALIERWNALREELDWYYNKLNEYESQPPPRPVEWGRDLRQNIRQREEELSNLLRQLQVQDPEYFSLQSVPHVASEDIAGDLAAGEILLEYSIAGDRIGVFVIDARGLRVAQFLGPASPVRDSLRKLRFQLNKHLLGVDYLDAHRAALHRFVNEHLRELHRALIEPVADALEGKRLIIVPHGFLHYIPFHALYDGEHYVIDDYEVSYAPSAHVFRLCRQRRRRPQSGWTPALIVGVPDEKLVHIRQEVEYIRRLIPGAEALVGEEATLERFRRRAQQARLLHLASHAVFRRDNPLFSAIQLSHSWLNFYDMFHLDLQAELVVLSACQTGVSKVFAGDELIGLMRGFLYAGAPSLILSLWAVHDQSTAEMMRVFYTELQQDHSARAALRKAQLAIRERYPHPYYWAPFVLMGRP